MKNEDCGEMNQSHPLVASLVQERENTITREQYGIEVNIVSDKRYSLSPLINTRKILQHTHKHCHVECFDIPVNERYCNKTCTSVCVNTDKIWCSTVFNLYCARKKAHVQHAYMYTCSTM